MSSNRTSSSHERKLRYRELLENLSELGVDDDWDNEKRMDQIASTVQETKQLLSEGNVQDHVKNPSERYLDSRVLQASSDLAVRCSKAVSGNVNTYDKHELAAHIRDNPDFWLTMFPREVPVSGYLFGTFAPTPPEERVRAPRRRAERQQLAALKAPEKVDKLEKSDDGSEMVIRIKRFIVKKYREGGDAPLSYFHLVVDPGSFSQTIENVYHVSFLVRDSVIAVTVDEGSGLPVVTPVTASPSDKRDISDENQFIVSLDMAEWQMLIDDLEITEPMMVLKR